VVPPATGGAVTVALPLLAVATALAVWALTAVVRRYAIRALLDVPNARSSHSMPTPRGGGLAIACCLLTALVVAWIGGWISGAFAAAALGGGALTAAVGWIDDHRALPPAWRLIAHFAAAFWAIHWLGSPGQLQVGAFILPLGHFAPVLTVLLIVWLLNLYNFMDGIDGLAGVEAVTACAGGAVLAALLGAPHVATIAILIGAAAAGFLVWNWAPAKIFLGDVGSGFLGYILAITALHSEGTGGPPLLAWLVLLGVFVTDATVTLLRRLARGEAVFSAHRSHAYQRAVQAGWSHAQVSGAVAVTNVALAGLALLAQANNRYSLLFAAAAAVGLLSLYRRVERRQPM
jgi:Fuc2NAc and GlcNAc transferase